MVADCDLKHEDDERRKNAWTQEVALYDYANSTDYKERSSESLEKSKIRFLAELNKL